MNKSCKAIAVYFFIALIVSACTNTKQATYFNELSNSELQYKVESLEPVIQKNDILNITVTSLNGEANQIFNLYSVSTSVGSVNAGTITQTSGYLVDQQGNIQLPMLGTIKVVGLSKSQLKETLTKSLVEKNILYDPIINIRYLNYRVTVLGEVERPSVINVPSEKITLLEALGLAGDLTMFAKRDNVLIIREEAEGKRISHHVNLNSNELLTSPFYYLRSNDVVYVSPTKANVANASTTRVWLPSLLAALSFVTIILDNVLE